MYPILFQVGEFILPSWHAFYVLGALTAYWLMLYIYRIAPSEQLSEKDLGRIYIWTYIAGYFGARVGAIVTEDGIGLENFAGLYQFGSMMMYGGAIGGGVAALIFIGLKRLPYRTCSDILIPAFLGAVSIGRIGCFLNGDDFGKAVSPDAGDHYPFWAVVFPNLGDNVHRYPVQLVESVVVAVIVIISIYIYSHRKIPPGFVGIGAGAAYAIARFFIEMLRGDNRGEFLFGVFSPSQAISIALLILFRVIAGRMVRRRTQ